MTELVVSGLLLRVAQHLIGAMEDKHQKKEEHKNPYAVFQVLLSKAFHLYPLLKIEINKLTRIKVDSILPINQNDQYQYNENANAKP